MDWIEAGAAGPINALRLRQATLGVAPQAAVPSGVRDILDRPRALLQEQGFGFRYTTSAERSVVSGDASLLYTDVYHHADGHTHALVSPASDRQRAEPCTVVWVTQMLGRTALATVNCCAHNLVSPPVGWVVHDDYLSDLGQAWQRHLARLPKARVGIVTDGVEFFRACKLAVEQLMPYCEQKGLLVREGAQWRLARLPALEFAWKRSRGQRKLARVKARARVAV